jgi:hypothetical protein
MKIIHIILIAVAVALTGCYGTTEDPTGGASIALVTVSPLPLVGRDAWTATVAGCEDRLDAAVSFGVAEGEPALVVALAADGAAICVDALEGVDLELRERGDEVVADDLCARYLAVIDDSSGRPTSSVAPRTADPSPQPNLVGADLDVDKGDPSPQPNLAGVTASDDGKATGSTEEHGTAATTTSTATTTPRRGTGPQEGDPSPQPNSQAMQSPAPGTGASSE